jgi:DHA3 family tetracycline resistance protein-like MFS transporter
MSGPLSWRARRPTDAVRTYYLYGSLWGLCYAMTSAVALLYMTTTVGLSPLQLVVVGSVLEATILVCEVPTGLVSDLYSRRFSVLIGLVLTGTGFLVQALAPTFAGLLIAQVVWGVGYTCTSGSDQAWLADEIGADRLGPVLLRAQQLELVATVVGIVAAGALGLVSIRIPLVVSGVGFLVLTAVLVVIMPEDNFAPTPLVGGRLRAVRQSLIAGLASARQSPVVRAILVISLLVGLSSEAVDRLWVLRIVDGIGVPHLPGGTVVLFAAISLVGTLVALASSLAVSRSRPDIAHPAGLLAGLIGVQVVGILGLAYFGNIWLALAGFWLRGAAVSLAEPIRSAWINRHIESRSRATVLSLTSQTDAVGQVVGGPPLGWLADRVGVPFALLVSALLLAPAAALYRRVRPTDSALAESAVD